MIRLLLRPARVMLRDAEEHIVATCGLQNENEIPVWCQLPHGHTGHGPGNDGELDCIVPEFLFIP